MRTRWTNLTLALAVAALGAAPAQAQRIVVAGGISSYDLSGTGTTGVASVRYEADLSSRFAVEVGAAVYRYEPQGGGHLTYLMPEVGVRASAPLRSAAVALTVGGGLAASVEGPDDTEPTLFAAVGLDLPLGRGWSLRPEARLRIVDPWVGTTGDATVGLARSFR